MPPGSLRCLTSSTSDHGDDTTAVGPVHLLQPTPARASRGSRPLPRFMEEVVDDRAAADVNWPGPSERREPAAVPRALGGPRGHGGGGGAPRRPPGPRP